jgi:cellulose synthase operon protein C
MRTKRAPKVHERTPDARSRRSVDSSQPAVRRTLQRLILALATLGACHRDPDPQLDSANVAAEPPPPSPPPEVEFAGCQATRREPLTCWLRGETTRLNLWVGARRVPVVQVDGGLSKVRTRPSIGEAGWTLDVDVPRGATELTVVVAEDVAPWRLTLEASDPTPTVDAVEATLPPENEPDRAKYESAEERLRMAAPRMSAGERLAAEKLRVLMLHALGRDPEAMAAGNDALDLALRAGRPAEALAITEILIYLVGQSGDAAAARLLLDLSRTYLPLVADATQTLRWHYYRGVQASAAGELGVALDELELAEGAARRLGLNDDELAAGSLRAPLLGLLGKHSERARLIDRVVALAFESPREARCQTANYLSAIGWSIILARAHSTEADDAEPVLAQALSYYAPSGGCTVGDNADSTRMQQEVRINYALEALTRRAWDVAGQREKLIEDAVLLPSQRRWLQLIRGELALQRGEIASALQAVKSLDQPEDPLVAWQAMVIRGRALEAEGEKKRALVAYRRAESLLDEVVFRLGVDQGREGLLAGMHSSAEHAIRLLLERREVREAVAVARRSRARARRPIGRAAALAQLPPLAREQWTRELKHYDELARAMADDLTSLWRLPEDERDAIVRRHAELRRGMRAHLDAAYAVLGSAPVGETGETWPANGELWLVYHPFREGWIGFAVGQDRVLASEIVRAPQRESKQGASARLLMPFAGSIEKANAVEVLAMGDLDAVPFHALPWKGDDLIAALPVSYRLDTSTSKAETHSGIQQTMALVVANPATADASLASLESAEQEGEDVAAALRSIGWTVDLLSGAGATRSQVIRSLAGADWFHYAGHGESGGGWDSGIALAGEARLDVRDVLALPRVPNTVVLSGCRTGTIDRRVAAGGEHLASAFLLAGSRLVIATSKDLDDAAALRFSRALYATYIEDPRVDGSQVLRRAVLRLRDDANVPMGALEGIQAWVP